MKRLLSRHARLPPILSSILPYNRLQGLLQLCLNPVNNQWLKPNPWCAFSLFMIICFSNINLKRLWLHIANFVFSFLSLVSLSQLCRRRCSSVSQRLSLVWPTLYVGSERCCLLSGPLMPQSKMSSFKPTDACTSTPTVTTPGLQTFGFVP